VLFNTKRGRTRGVEEGSSDGRRTGRIEEGGDGRRTGRIEKGGDGRRTGRIEEGGDGRSRRVGLVPFEHSLLKSFSGISSRNKLTIRENY
jgi:hypothetical protein